MSGFAVPNQRDTKESLLHQFVSACIGFVITIPMVFWEGFVGMTLWNWFIPAIFPAMPRLSIIATVGIGFVIAFFTHRREQTPNNETSLESLFATVVDSLAYGVLALIFGAIFHAWL